MSSKPTKAPKPVPPPKLRFKGFEGEWVEQELSELASLITRRVGDETHTPMSIISGVGLVSQVEKFGKSIAGAQYKRYFVIEKNDFAYNKSATKDYPEGFLTMHTADETGAVPNSIFTCFRANSQRAIPDYLNYLFQDNLHGKWLRRFIAVGARANGALTVDNADLMSTPVPLPSSSTSLQEQAHIAAALSSLDAVITAEAEALEALRQHKRGLMQQLFPQEGERVPRVRFAEFAEAGEWEEKKLGEVFTQRKERGNNNLPLLSLMDGKGIIPQEMTNRRNVSSEDKSRYLRVAIGDIAYNTMRMWEGRSAYSRLEGLVSPAYTICVPINGSNALFFSYAFKTSNAIREFKKYSQGIVKDTLNLKFEVFETISFAIPSLPEQERIAAVLSSLDELLAVRAEKLERLRHFKRGLMQGLFPRTGGAE